MDTVRAELGPDWVLDHQLRGALLLVFLEIFSSSPAMEEVWCHPEEVDLARLRSTRVVVAFAVVVGKRKAPVSQILQNRFPSFSSLFSLTSSSRLHFDHNVLVLGIWVCVEASSGLPPLQALHSL